MPGTSCAKALQYWSERNQDSIEKAPVIKLMCLHPPIDRMDNSLNALAGVVHLSLSTNCIDKMMSLSGLRNLEILSLGRNMIKRIEGLEGVGSTLKQLWLSYNLISSLDGLQSCVKLENLYISNNKIKDWNEVKKLAVLPNLGNVTLFGNPCYDGYNRQSVRPIVQKYFPLVRILDGEMITDQLDEVLDQARVKLSKIHGGLENALVAAFSVRTEAIPRDICVEALIGLGLASNLAETVYGKMDPEMSGSVDFQVIREAFGVL